MNDPRSMKREDIIKFFQHIALREGSHGIPNAFRFKAVLSSRKKGKLVKTRYFDDHEPALPEVPAPEQTEDTEPALLGGPDPAIGECSMLDRPPDTREQVPTPAMTPELTLAQLGPGPGPGPGPGSKSQRKKKSQRTNNLPSANPDNPSTTLTLDPAFRIDPPINLDPALEFHSNMDSELLSLSGDLFSPWPNATLPSHNTIATSRNPEQSASRLVPDPAFGGLLSLDSNPTTLQIRRSPRRMGKDAEALEREDAKSYAPKRKSRR